MSDGLGAARADSRRRTREVIALGVGIAVLFVLATWLPNLLPSSATGLQFDQVHAVMRQPASVFRNAAVNTACNSLPILPCCL